MSATVICHSASKYWFTMATKFVGMFDCVASVNKQHYAVSLSDVCLSLNPSVTCLRFSLNRKAVETSNLVET